jgi:hypothetical protein
MGRKTRDLLLRQRIQASNALRGHLAELGVVAPQGRTSLGKLVEVIADHKDTSIPEVARMALQDLVAQIEDLTGRVERLDQDVVASVKADTDARRLTSIPGVGPIIAATVRAVVPDPAGFRTGRDFAAWVGLTPRSHASGGKARLGAISKRGNKLLRTLLIVGRHRSSSWPGEASRCRNGLRRCWRGGRSRVSPWRWPTRSPAPSGLCWSRAGCTRRRQAWPRRSLHTSSPALRCRRERQGAQDLMTPKGRYPEANQTVRFSVPASTRL